MQSVSEWAQLNFGSCKLGDKRRTGRLVRVAEEIANNPSASLPSQIERWGDLKAAYRLFDRKEVTFEAIKGFDAKFHADVPGMLGDGPHAFHSPSPFVRRRSSSTEVS